LLPKFPEDSSEGEKRFDLLQPPNMTRSSSAWQGLKRRGVNLRGGGWESENLKTTRGGGRSSPKKTLGEKELEDMSEKVGNHCDGKRH